MSGDDGFLSRWSRRKVQARQQPGPVTADALPDQARVVASEVRAPLEEAQPAHAALAEGAAPATESPAPPVEPAPTLDDVARLPPGADIGRFLSPTVDEGVKRAALKKLFADPHFNVMDGLDTYIDDYSKPDPLPLAMLRRLAQAQALGLVDEASEPAAGDDASHASDAAQPPKASPDGAAAATVPQSADASFSAVPPDEDPDLRLQQDHAAGCGRAGEGPGA